MPGTRLLIEDLAGRLNVSPIPVREALQQLQAEGFVVIEPYVGATVAPIELESIDEVFRLLETMEMVSSVAACRHMSDEGFVELHSLLVHMDSLLDDPEAWSAANKQFHQLICDRSGTRLVGSLMPRVSIIWTGLQTAIFSRMFLPVYCRRRKGSIRQSCERSRNGTSRGLRHWCNNITGRACKRLRNICGRPSQDGRGRQRGRVVQKAAKPGLSRRAASGIVWS